MKKWVVDLTTATGPAIRLHAGASEVRGQLLIGCSDETFHAMASRSLSPEMAFFRRLVTIKGNATLVPKVKELLKFTAEIK